MSYVRKVVDQESVPTGVEFTGHGPRPGLELLRFGGAQRVIVQYLECGHVFTGVCRTHHPCRDCEFRARNRGRLG